MVSNGTNVLSSQLLTFLIPKKSNSVHLIFYDKGEFRNLTWSSEEMEQKYNRISIQEREKMLHRTSEDSGTESQRENVASTNETVHLSSSLTRRKTVNNQHSDSTQMEPRGNNQLYLVKPM